jgi:nicotinamidase-related amidase
MMKNVRGKQFVKRFAAGALFAVAGLAAVPASAQTIVDEWASVKPPAAPELKSATVDPKTTAFLALDFVRQTCNSERRPRCIASIPRVQKFLAEVRAKGLTVIYSVIPGSTNADILKEVTPAAGEAVVTAGADKFIGTDFEKMLRDRGIKTVIIAGTAAHGAVLYTASGAALRGIQVVVPVDGMSAENTYAEQVTAWQLTNAPTISNRVTLTKFDQIRF